MLEIMGEPESTLLWENHNSWGGFSNSENSGGGQLEKVEAEDNREEQQATVLQATVVTTGKKRGRGGREKSCKATGGGAEGKEGKKGGGESSDHEMHIWTERERRKKMRNMFANLHALLPQLPPKAADKSTIVDEAVNYIKTLEETVQKLGKHKSERLHGVTTINFDPTTLTPTQKIAHDSTRESFLAEQVSSPSNNNNLTITPTNSSSNIASMASVPATFPVLFQTYTSQNVVLNVCGNLAQISVCSVKKPGLLTAICYVLEKHKLEVISAHISSDYNRSIYMIQVHAGGVSDQTLEAFSVEEIYKQAAGEIMFWVASG